MAASGTPITNPTDAKEQKSNPQSIQNPNVAKFIELVEAGNDFQHLSTWLNRVYGVEHTRIYNSNNDLTHIETGIPPIVFQDIIAWSKTTMYRMMSPEPLLRLFHLDRKPDRLYLQLLINLSRQDEFMSFIKENIDRLETDKTHFILSVLLPDEKFHALAAWIVNNKPNLYSLNENDTFIDLALNANIINRDLILRLGVAGCTVNIFTLAKKCPELVNDLLDRSPNAFNIQNLADALSEWIQSGLHRNFVDQVIAKRPDAARKAQLAVSNKPPLHVAVHGGPLHLPPSSNTPEDMKLIQALCDDAVVELNGITHVLDQGYRSAIELAADRPPYVAAKYFIEKHTKRIASISLAHAVIKLAEAKNAEADKVIALAFKHAPELHNPKYFLAEKDAKCLTSVLERECKKPDRDSCFITALCNAGATPPREFALKASNEAMEKVYLEKEAAKLSFNEAKGLFQKHILENKPILATILAKKRKDVREEKETPQQLSTAFRHYVTEEKQPDIETIKDLCRLTPVDPMKQDKERRVLFLEMLNTCKYAVAKVFIAIHYAKLTATHLAEPYLTKYKDAEKAGFNLLESIHQLRPDLKKFSTNSDTPGKLLAAKNVLTAPTIQMITLASQGTAIATPGKRS